MWSYKMQTRLKPVFPVMLVRGEMMKDKESNRERIQSDPLGSYTGRPENPHEVPVQDADDL